MDIGRAFTFIFDDQEWTMKIGIAAAIAFVSIITTPILIGLVGWAALLGYQVDLIRNLRDGHHAPLPRWDDYADKITTGASVLTAGFIYALPNILVSCCMFATSGFWSDGFFGSAVGLGITCCIFPFLLIYNLTTWPMMALALGRYAEERNIGVFFQFGDLFDTLRRNMIPVLQWALYTIIANILFGIVAAIPCIGWAVAPALWIPVQGYLTSGMVSLIETPMRGPANPPKPKRRPR